ncbi:RsmB/NOP family class I SAM-dependent RNA methyltransferase [Archaeoglobus profundus]|uniref:RNA methylase, NOL1/NOP2/sun family n=1 Tax=Archaeoglobus profundus (strain DSM 5631 / JCM 9629 / NBRC 100127 / Av18) TaxID=572546 RepID=D2RG94_ARCPA|nr:RsmB/NOP family class I SAM-dependent RNA methyltransferase [Archaeoglobus profundus]ADB57319.1 RNA methylase, NOL1/NOP2/sun family [Archaeoglobus profundus DSM 5631]
MYRIKERDFVILTEVLRKADEIKPSQYAKRMVFEKYNILGTHIDRILTAVYYKIMKRLGVIDKIIRDVVGVHPNILDPWLRSALRVTIEFLVFEKKYTKHLDKERVKKVVADFLSNVTHPYVGMYYFETFERIASYKLEPKDEIERLEFEYLLPAWYIRKMKELLGEEAEELFKAFNREPMISIRVNTLKATVKEVIDHLRRQGKEVIVSSVVPTVLKFEGPYDFDKSKLYRKGKFVVQEEASALASILLDPKPNETVVDLCAAPGGKTIHMAELMRNRGVIHAFDVDELRLKRMEELIKRCGVKIVKIYKMDARKAVDVLGESIADKVMLDAPCTSDGTLMKNPELRWRIREEKIEEIAQLQYELLNTGIDLLKPKGRILYCTCSIFREENEDVVERVLKERDDVKLVPLEGYYSEGFLKVTIRAFPHKHNTIGFFYALLEKTE